MSVIKLSPLPSVGVCEARVLRALRRASYRGSAANLARLIGFSEASTWRALAGLAGKRLINAAKTDDGGVDVRITDAGRRVG
jgi:DNA-binding IclR family transcriptional regulator